MSTSKSSTSSAPKPDAIDAYISVHNALKNLTSKGISIGRVINDDGGNDEDTKDTAYLQFNDDLNQLDQVMSFVASGWIGSQDGNQIQVGLHRTKADENTKDSDDVQVLQKETVKMDAFNLDIQRVLPFCKPAPYGDLKTQTTILDTNVRRAFETGDFTLTESYTKYDRSRKGITHESSPPRFFESIRSAIRQYLFSVPVSLKPYKLIVYTEGGFFAAHVDTPIDTRNMIGNLVLCLPTKHTGGELIISHSGLSYEVNFSTRCAAGQNAPIQWAAFFGDCAHEVKPVTSGNRVTVVYAIIADEKSSAASSSSAHSYPFESRPNVNVGPDILTITNQRVRDVIEDALAILEVDKRMGIISSHKYTFSALVPDRLKGRDKIIFDAFKAEGWKVELVPVAYYRYRTLSEDSGYGDSDDSDNVYLLSNEHIDYLRGARKHPPASKFGDADIKFCLRARNPGHEMMHNTTDPENQGNWVEPGTDEAIYFAAAMVISLPKKKKENKVTKKKDDDGDDDEEEEEEEEGDDDE